MDSEYNMTQLLTENSDVYSFGVVMLELLIARPPIQNGKYIVWEFNEAIDKSPNELYKILDPYLGSSQTIGCVQDLGVDRPKMGEVVREIKTIIDLVVSILDVESPSTSSSQNTGKLGDLIQSLIRVVCIHHLRRNYTGELWEDDENKYAHQ